MDSNDHKKFEQLKAKQDIQRKKNKKTFKLHDFTSKEFMREVMCGVLRENGMMVASDGHILVAIKKGYPDNEDGKSIVEKDKFVKKFSPKKSRIKFEKGYILNGRYPNWKILFKELPVESDIDPEDLLDFVAACKDIVEEDHIRLPGTNLREMMRLQRFVIRFSDGTLSDFQIDYVEKFAYHLKKIGATKVSSSNVGTGTITANTDKGCAALCPRYLYEVENSYEGRRVFCYDLMK